MDSISDDLLAYILGWAHPLELLEEAALVCHRFESIVAKDIFWRLHPLIQHQQLLHHQLRTLTKHQLQRCCIMEADAPDTPGCLDYGTALPSRSEAKFLRENTDRRVCVASTTDHEKEAIENVLQDDDYQFNIVRTNWEDDSMVSWWSSQPAPRDNSIETLMFATKYPLTVILRVKICPLRDPYLSMIQDVFYTWKKTVIRAYRLPLELLVHPDRDPLVAGFPCMFPSSSFPFPTARHTTRENAIHLIQLQNLLLMMGEEAPGKSEHSTIDHMLENHSPIYESEEYDVPANSNDTLTYEVSTPHNIVAANIITVSLIGKNSEQREGGGFYACIDNLDCEGLPLYTSSEQQNIFRRWNQGVDDDDDDSMDPDET